jgi:3-oxoadipate enol-lactonase
MPWADARDVRLYYEVEGDGPAILFAHGAGGNTASWWQQVPAFSRTHRVITFDHRGFGRSTCAPEHFDPARFEHDALAVLDAAGVERAALVCQSMGGWTGVRLAAHYPSRVTKLVLANTPGAIHTDALIEQMRKLVARPRDSDLTTFTLGEPYRRAQPAGTYLYRAISAFNVTPMPIEKLTRRESFVDPSRLKPFPVPVLMIASTLDVTFPLALLEATARTIGAEIRVIEDAGHSTYFERPAEFNAAVRRFLEN